MVGCRTILLALIVSVHLCGIPTLFKKEKKIGNSTDPVDVANKQPLLSYETDSRDVVTAQALAENPLIFLEHGGPFSVSVFNIRTAPDSNWAAR
jgi:hypothetical protein